MVLFRQRSQSRVEEHSRTAGPTVVAIRLSPVACRLLLNVSVKAENRHTHPSAASVRRFLLRPRRADHVAVTFGIIWLILSYTKHRAMAPRRSERPTGKGIKQSIDRKASVGNFGRNLLDLVRPYGELLERPALLLEQIRPVRIGYAGTRSPARCRSAPQIAGLRSRAPSSARPGEG